MPKEQFNITDVANLARLNLTERDKKSLEEDLSKIITYIEKLNELDTTSVEATSHVLNIENVYREDKVVDSASAKEVLKVLPDSRKNDNFFKVPKVIEDN